MPLIMHAEDRQSLFARRGFETHGVAGSAVHQGLCQGRYRTDSSLARLGFIRANYLVSFFLSLLIADANGCTETDLPRISGCFGNNH